MQRKISALSVHVILLAYTALALFPIVLTLVNSVKARKAIFGAPLALPTPSTFSLIGYQKVFSDSSVMGYYVNSLTVTLVTVAAVLLLGAMAAWGLSEYR